MAKKPGRKKLPFGQKLQSICIQLRVDQIERIARIEIDPRCRAGFAAQVRQVVDAGLKALEVRE